MASYAIPPIGTAYIFYVGLIDQSNTNLLKASPSLSSGDFKVSIDGGAFANLTTLPTETPAAGSSVKISLSAAEMNGANIVVKCVDAAGAEWCDQLVNIQTMPANPMLTNTALAAWEFGMVLASDHISAATGKTVTVQRSIDGGAYANSTAVTATEVSAGTYKIDLSAADRNGTVIKFRATATACDPTEWVFVMQPA